MFGHPDRTTQFLGVVPRAEVPAPAGLGDEIDQAVQAVLAARGPVWQRLLTPHALAALLTVVATLASWFAQNLSAGAAVSDLFHVLVVVAAAEAATELGRIAGIAFGQPLNTGAERPAASASRSATPVTRVETDAAATPIAPPPPPPVPPAR